MSFINGIIGGFNAQGELICNFYFESMEMPKEQEGRIEGTELKVDDIPKPMVFKRDIKCGIIMTPQQIYAVRGWLDDKITEFEKKFKMNK